MKLTLSWLKEYLDTSHSLDEIVDGLNRVGLVVDSVNDPSKALAPFKVVEIVTTQPHPNAERLQICTVQSIDGISNVVCGAPNARAGLKTIFAQTGDVIPSTGAVLKPAVIRGVPSEGMLCSAAELALGVDSDGIIEIDPATPIGTPAAQALGCSDATLDIEITPNRGDCLGVLGIARDLAAAGLGKLKSIPSMALKTGAGAGCMPVSLNDTSCPFYTNVVLEGVRNGSSPLWMQQRLQAIGLRPISALVDSTNYVMMATGQPLHAFDADTLKGSLTVRKARDGEVMEALDDKAYVLNATMTVIADDAGPVALAGIMGSKRSGCTDATTNVVLECALFNAHSIAQTGRALSIISDARYRFERHVDPAQIKDVLMYAGALMVDICCGVAGVPQVFGVLPSRAKPTSFDPARVVSFTGMVVTHDRMQAILVDLGFHCDVAQTPWLVTPPSWRHDMAEEVDMVEEIVRIVGYDQLPSTPMPGRPGQYVLSTLQQRPYIARRALVARGMNELVTWSFLSHERAALFGGGGDDLCLVNPLNQNMAVMRPSLLPQLLETLAGNQRRGQHDLAFFEVGPSFGGTKPSDQRLVAGGVRVGSAEDVHFLASKRDVDSYDAKADAEAVLKACGITLSSVQLSDKAPTWYHPGRSGSVMQGKNILATFGELHPSLLKTWDITGRVVGFEVFISAIKAPKAKSAAKSSFTPSAFQATHRDFAFIVPRSVHADQILRLMTKASPHITTVQVFDVFCDQAMQDKGVKSLAFRVRLEPQDKTLTDEDITSIAAHIIEQVKQTTGGTLRA